MADKKILLIIDPQNDFSEANPNITPPRELGPLGVGNSNVDYENIAKLIKENIFEFAIQLFKISIPVFSI